MERYAGGMRKMNRICAEKPPRKFQLTEGKCYEILEINTDKYGEEWLTVEDDNGKIIEVPGLFFMSTGEYYG